VEAWVAEHATIGAGSTPASETYEHYRKCCEAFGIAVISTNTFAAELSDLFVEKKRTNKGVFYGLTLR
jgi:hypothetical protein